jgi:hypothetical protein
MKTLTALFLFSLLCACNNSHGDPDSVQAPDSVYYPIAPVHSNEFEKGQPQHAMRVLQVWRQYETGNVKKESASFSDSIRFILPDVVWNGKKDSVLSLYQKRREGYSNMQSFVYSWMPVHVSDEGDDMVWVWGLYDGTRKNGQRDYAIVHEVWRFDRNGKIKELEQFRTHPH